MTLPRRRFIAAAAGFGLYAALPATAWARSPAIYAEDGIAIDGTDPLSYFNAGAPQAGSPDITHDWNGATWRFTTAAHRDSFAADPAAFAPQYGGYCAYAVSKGSIASTIPEAWKIVDGKLYLNFSQRIQRRWERDIPALIEAADANWPTVLDA